jgi:hypothetical protein
MRVIGAIVLILGLAAIVLGVLFMLQANSGQQEIADQIAPLLISQVNDKYDQVDAAVEQMKTTAGGQVQPDNPMFSNYINVFAQRSSLGLSKSNIGNVKAVRMSGIIDIGIGLGLVLTGAALFRKVSA